MRRFSAFWQLVEALSQGNSRGLSERLLRFGESASIEVSPALAGQVPPGTVSQVYVNMIKKDVLHFEEVAASVRHLSDQNFWTVAHIPASRFSEVETARSVIRKLQACGAKGVLLLAGNDALEYDARSDFPHSAMSLLPLLPPGLHSVSFASYPEDETAARVLEMKCRAAMQYEICLVSQFTLDPSRLIAWLAQTRSQLAGLPVRYRIGLPGPTPVQRLHRIAQICQVPIPKKKEDQLQLALTILGTDRDGILRRSKELPDAALRAFANDLCCTNPTRLGHELSSPALRAASSQRQGPSTFVDSRGISSTESELFIPINQILALAHYCERAHVEPGEIALHFYPFDNCLQSTLGLIADLQRGRFLSKYEEE